MAEGSQLPSLPKGEGPCGMGPCMSVPEEVLATVLNQKPGRTSLPYMPCGKLERSLAGDIVDRSMLEVLNEDLRPQVESLLSHLGIFQTTERRESCDLWQTVHFLCSSLEDLDYEIIPLLEAILEKKTIAKHLEMVASVLQWILSGEEGSVFVSPARSLTDEEAAVAAEMLQICELDSEAKADSVTCLWNNEACSELAALYSSFYAFKTLSE